MARQVLLLLLCAAAGWSQNTAAFFQAGKIRALIISGRNNHDWRATPPLLRQQLIDTGKFDVRVTEEPSGMTRETVAAYDVLILDYNGPRWGETAAVSSGRRSVTPGTSAGTKRCNSPAPGWTSAPTTARCSTGRISTA